MIIEMAVASPKMLTISADGRIDLTEAGRKEAIPAVEAHLQKEAPEWVKTVAKRLSMSLAMAEQREAVATEKEAALTDMIERAGPILTPEQQEIASAARQVMRQPGMPLAEMER